MNQPTAVLPPRLSLDEGSLVQHNETVYQIAEILDFESVLAEPVEGGRKKVLLHAELEPLPFDDESDFVLPLDVLDEKDEQRAQQRLAILQPLLDILEKEKRPYRRAEVERQARKAGVHATTVYHWLRRYLPFRDITTLIPRQRGWAKGRKRLPEACEPIIKEFIEDFYLTPEKPSVHKTMLLIRGRCVEKGISVLPSYSSVYARIQAVPKKERLKRRGSEEEAGNAFRPAPGHFPGADYPLAVVQIDHTKVDIILVDDRYRRPIGRPWITLAIDVHSRMVTGYYLSFDDPSEASVGLCVSNSVLPKEELLLRFDVDAKWPVWGFPKTLHVDNGPDFRSDGFRTSCGKHGIHIEFRPVKRPEYGAHIERLLGTLAKQIHELPGTTSSSVAKRGEYDSEKHAAFTKTEFEKWLLTLICKYYHQRGHKGIKMAPSRKWELGILGNDTTPGIGLPQKPANRFDIVRDFMPQFERTVQRTGVSLEGMAYYAPVLKRWINASSPTNPETKRKFVFRRDPRDIKNIWFFEPDSQQYYQVPTADQSLPRMSIWEFNEAKKRIREEGGNPASSTQLLRAVAELQKQKEQAQDKSKQARRDLQRQKDHAEAQIPATSASKKEEVPPGMSDELWQQPIKGSWKVE